MDGDILVTKLTDTALWESLKVQNCSGKKVKEEVETFCVLSVSDGLGGRLKDGSEQRSQRVGSIMIVQGQSCKWLSSVKLGELS